MRRVFRWAWNMVAAASLLMCVATTIVLGHGCGSGSAYRWADLQEPPGGVLYWSDHTIASADGRLTYWRNDQTAVEPPAGGHGETWRRSKRMYDRDALVYGRGYAPDLRSGGNVVDRFGVRTFSFSARAQNPTLDQFGLSVPLWPFPPALAIAPALWLAGWWRRRRARPGRPGGFPVVATHQADAGG